MEQRATLARLGPPLRTPSSRVRRTVRLSPNDPRIAGQRGWTLQWCGKYDEAFGEFERAVALQPDFAEALVSKGMLKLLLGDLREGFALYEWRWRLPGSPNEPSSTAPLWLGETDIAGKTLLIQAEQGIGDTIQFCRYAMCAAKAGARVIIQVFLELVRLNETTSRRISMDDFRQRIQRPASWIFVVR